MSAMAKAFMANMCFESNTCASIERKETRWSKRGGNSQATADEGRRWELQIMTDYFDGESVHAGKAYKFAHVT